MEFLDELFAVVEMIDGFPCIFFRGVALPLNKVFGLIYG